MASIIMIFARQTYTIQHKKNVLCLDPFRILPEEHKINRLKISKSQIALNLISIKIFTVLEKSAVCPAYSLLVWIWSKVMYILWE